MKICIINPPNNWSDEQISTEHIGIAYIAAYLENNGHKVTLLDCPFLGINYNEVCSILAQEKFNAVGISTYFYNVLFMKRIVRYIKARLINTFVFIGGYLPTLSHERLYDDLKYIDCMVRGEGEEAVSELIDNVGNNIKWKDIKGLVYMESNNIMNAITIGGVKYGKNI